MNPVGLRAWSSSVWVSMFTCRVSFGGSGWRRSLHWLSVAPQPREVKEPIYRSLARKRRAGFEPGRSVSRALARRHCAPLPSLGSEGQQGEITTPSRERGPAWGCPQTGTSERCTDSAPRGEEVSPSPRSVKWQYQELLPSSNHKGFPDVRSLSVCISRDSLEKQNQEEGDL